MRTLAIQTTEDVISEAEAREMVSGVIALSESMLDRLSAKLSGIELVEKRLDDMWYISAVEGSELARAVEKVTAVSDLFTTVTVGTGSALCGVVACGCGSLSGSN